MSCSLAPLGASASYLHSATCCQVFIRSVWCFMWDFGFEPGRKSRRSLPRSICAGDMPVSLSGVFLRVRSPFTSVTVSSSPLGLTASQITHLAVPTDLSAFWLACGNPTEVSLWWTPSFLRNSLVLPAIYSGPPSDVKVSGKPKLWKDWPRSEMRVWAPPFPVKTWTQLLNLSTTRQKLWPFREKKSEQTCWNGYSGVSGVIGGSGDWLGLVSSQEMQDMRLLAMSLAKFCQNRFLSAPVSWRWSLGVLHAVCPAPCS